MAQTLQACLLCCTRPWSQGLGCTQLDTAPSEVIVQNPPTQQLCKPLGDSSALHTRPAAHCHCTNGEQSPTQPGDEIHSTTTAPHALCRCTAIRMHRFSPPGFLPQSRRVCDCLENMPCCCLHATGTPMAAHTPKLGAGSCTALSVYTHVRQGHTSPASTHMAPTKYQV